MGMLSCGECIAGGAAEKSILFCAKAIDGVGVATAMAAGLIWGTLQVINMRM